MLLYGWLVGTFVRQFCVADDFLVERLYYTCSSSCFSSDVSDARRESDPTRAIVILASISSRVFPANITHSFSGRSLSSLTFIQA